MAKTPKEPEPVDVKVRGRLRELRAERGLTLAEVAERAALDVSTLSRLESGKRRLAVDHLPGLSAALGVSVDQLIGSHSAPDPRVVSEPHRLDGMTLWPLNHPGASGGLAAFKVHINTRRRKPPDQLPVHAGNDWLYVLSGRLRLLLGDDEHLIEAGEAAEFSTWTPHWFGAAEGPVELIMIFGPEGERLHLHE
jgi:transcriptional regulator with XRE-family HTH domain